MSEINLETVLAQAQQLPPGERQRLIELLSRESSPPPEKKRGRRVPPPVPYKDRSREYQWLKDHAREYVGQWVALEGDQLVAHGARGAEVLAEAKRKGFDRPLLLQVEDPDNPPLIIFK